ncbi:hypothetical protein [Hymenobacter swuensis]|uniref:Uncharacterized protein n=1 Tax=Hymenobacter swuensis DY53 TaxID=1227739 RepID=W8EW63_9BACT|nr:hypothetical protein [Hymenobacter swuensis]AHJ95977.1 hypothetical protein Hsw_0382 [Hymenobacter swuensis DY53]
MKSLLRFSLMLSLVVIGKINQSASVTASVAKAGNSTLQLPVQNASFFHHTTSVKRKIEGGGSRFWQATAPAAVTANTME